MTGLETFISLYNELSAESIFKDVLKRILIHPNETSKMTIYDLADFCYTSPSTISRLVKRLGYKNYAIFQKELSDSISKYENHNRLIPVEQKTSNSDLSDIFLNTLVNMIDSVRENIPRETISNLVEMLHKSKSVAIYSHIGSLADTILQSDLFVSGIVCDIFHKEVDMLAHTATLTADDFIIFIAPKRIFGDDTEDSLKAIHQTKAKICLITDSQYYTGKKYADFNLIFDGILYSIDMFLLQIILSLISLEYRKRFLDDVNNQMGGL